MSLNNGKLSKGYICAGNSSWVLDGDKVIEVKPWLINEPSDYLAQACLLKRPPMVLSFFSIKVCEVRNVAVFDR